MGHGSSTLSDDEVPDYFIREVKFTIASPQILKNCFARIRAGDEPVQPISIARAADVDGHLAAPSAGAAAAAAPTERSPSPSFSCRRKSLPLTQFYDAFFEAAPAVKSKLVSFTDMSDFLATLFKILLDVPEAHLEAEKTRSRKQLKELRRKSASLLEDREKVIGVHHIHLGRFPLDTADYIEVGHALRAALLANPHACPGLDDAEDATILHLWMSSYSVILHHTLVDLKLGSPTARKHRKSTSGSHLERPKSTEPSAPIVGESAAARHRRRRSADAQQRSTTPPTPAAAAAAHGPAHGHSELHPGAPKVHQRRFSMSAGATHS